MVGHPMKYSFWIAVPLLIAGFLLQVGEVVLSRFEAHTEGNAVIVQWETQLEQGVVRFYLERKTQQEVSFRAVKEMRPHGPGKLYRYKDDHVYKQGIASQVQYRLRIVYENGASQIIPPIAVDYTSTAIRRTWGSIKAMFQ